MLHRLLFCTLLLLIKSGVEKMRYLNAADVLPRELLLEVAQYASGKLLYVPALSEKY